MSIVVLQYNNRHKKIGRTSISQDPDDDEKGMGPSFTEGSTQVLEHFGRDLTLLAAKGELDPVIGREEEIDMMVQILNKRKKNNPIIVGEAGTGKTALVEGLALRIVNRKTDRWLLNKRIIELNLSSLVGGTKYRGQFEERMKAIIDEAVKNDDVIIFIDEIHNLMGAGGASGSMDASQIIKTRASSWYNACYWSNNFRGTQKNNC